MTLLQITSAGEAKLLDENIALFTLHLVRLGCIDQEMDKALCANTGEIS